MPQCPFVLFFLPMVDRDKLRKQLSSRKYYEANKAKVKARTREYTTRVRKTVREWIRDYLREHPCVDCGETNPIVLEFDHVRGKKEFNIGEATSKGRSLKRVQAEVEKCEVRCANCHRQKTYKEAGWTHRH